MSELSASGKVIYRARLSDVNTSYRAFESTWHAQPTTPPAVAATVSGSTTSVYASWNGATTVASWRVLTGSSATGLTAGATTRASGFETAIKVAGTPDDRIYAALCKEAIEKAGPFGPFPFVVPDMYRNRNLEIRWSFNFL